METVVSSYPKRVDLWSVYIDMELKHSGPNGEVAVVWLYAFYAR
jgi:hypothetical protein